MDKIKCDNCGEEFSKEEIENHKLYCIFSLQNSELQDLIPCEICDELISADSYNQHISMCGLSGLLPFPPTFFSIPLVNVTNEIGVHSTSTSTPNDLLDETINSVQNAINNTEIAIRSAENTINSIENTLNSDDTNEDSIEENPANNQPVQNLNVNNFIENTNILIQNINSINNTINYLNVENNDYESLINLDNNNQTIGVKDINKFIEYSGDEIICTICTEKTTDSYKTICNHLFCLECIEEWLKDNKKCPICMKEFIE